MPATQWESPRPMRYALVAAILLGVTLAAGAAFAQGQSVCPSGNLLRGRLPVQSIDTRGDLRLLTDEQVVPEGAEWNSPPAVILGSGASTITYDLGAAIPVQAVYIQADNNDVYHVWGSADGSSYKLLGQIDPVDQIGMRGRKLGVGGVAVRYLRVGEGVGDNAYSISEIVAYCDLPNPFPPSMRQVNAPVAVAPTNFFTYWNNDSSARWEMILALLGFGLLYWGAELKKAGKEQMYRKLRDRALMVLGGISFLTYFNFGFAHFNGTYIHDWEWTHYYIGSKYFSELQYDRLYECIAVADTEADPYNRTGLKRRVELRKLTNLRTNVLEQTADTILKHPETCKQQFTPARWESFKKDVQFFRDRQGIKRWDDLQMDHGYNATPVWNILGHLLSNLGPASKTQLYILALLDPLFIIGLTALIWWAFGWRVTCIGLMVFATNFPSRFYWTGGAFLRWDWLFCLVAGVCCLKKEKPILGGFLLAYSTLLRVFPMFVFVGPLAAAGWELFKHRRLDRKHLRFFAGAALAVALLVPLSLKVSGGTEAYHRFVQNTAKHKETPLTNYMGLRTVVAYRPTESGRWIYNDRAIDPWGKWKQARLNGYKEAKPIYFLIVLAYLGLIAVASRGRPLWQTVALSSTFIAVGVELTCYYYAFIIAVALLTAEDERVGRLLLLLTAYTGFIDWRPEPHMPDGFDEKYTFMSIGTLIIFALILWDFGLGPLLEARRAARAPAASPEGAPAAAVPSPSTPSAPAEPKRGGKNGRKKKRH
jgi:hypothetical protein